MADREKVIQGLKCRAYDNDFPCHICAYYKRDDEHAIPYCDYRGLMDDAIVLLKEQEAVKPKKVKGFNPPIYLHLSFICDNCKTDLITNQPYCSGCGRPVKWE